MAAAKDRNETSALIARALAVESPSDLDALWTSLSTFAPHLRPVGDRWGNRGMFTAAGGNFDHKLVELVSNMHDAVLLRRALALRPELRGRPAHYESAFDNPRAAVDALFPNEPAAELAKLSTVELRSAGDANKRLRTVVFRDRGVGLTPEDFAASLFRVGSSHKDGVLWQMGAFGRGGLTVLPNCYGWVVVSRPVTVAGDPADVISISAVRWQRIGNRQTETAVYQVGADFDLSPATAHPPAFEADNFSEFAAGTHLAVVGFQAEGVGVSRLGDERSIDTVFDTRMFDPPLPTSLTAPVLRERSSRTTLLRGLGPRMASNPRGDRREGHDELPFRFAGRTYRLPIRYFLFPSGDSGSRRRFVARDHALVLTSNGQTHSHWSPAEFRHRTHLAKLSDRILIVVETDPLPLEMRTTIFTADRTELLRNSEGVRLEDEIVSFLDDWDDLRRANSELIRDAIRKSNVSRSTVAVAERIARIVQLKSQPQLQPAGRERGQERPKEPKVLLDDPNEFRGPAIVRLTRGRTGGIHFSLDAYDGFIPSRTSVTVTTSHLDIDPDTDITVSELRNGRLRVSVAVPADAEVVPATLTVTVNDWLSKQGGLRSALTHRCELQVVDPQEAAQAARQTPTQGGPGDPARVAVLWSSHVNEADWSPTTVGDIDSIEADDLSHLHEGFVDLRGKHFEVPVLKLNEEFSPLKQYASVRARTVADEGVARAKDRYALGVGVQMFLLDEEVRHRRTNGEEVSDDLIARMREIAARGVLAVLPDFDAIISEAGLRDV
jgi:hypothetical protein